MRIKSQEIVPLAFWVAFLALGLVTGLAGHDPHGAQKNGVAKSHSKAVVASEAPSDLQRKN